MVSEKGDVMQWRQIEDEPKVFALRELALFRSL
jgi:hypothetical protein